MKRTLALILALLMVFCLFAACGDKKEEKKDDKPDTGATADPNKSYTLSELLAMETHPSDTAEFKFSFYNTFVGMSGIGQAQDAKLQIGCLFFENLFTWDDGTNSPIPWLAKEYEWVDDTTFRVKLHDNIYSIAGDHFTANDVVWTFQYQIDNGLLGSYFNIYDRDKIVAVDDYTVDIVVKQPYPFIMFDLANDTFQMGCEASAKKVAYDEATGTWDNTKLLWDVSYGTGPYNIVETDELSYLKSERRDDYWHSFKPYYKTVSIYGAPDPNTRVFGVEAGDYDATHQVTFSTAADYLEGDELKVFSIPSAGNLYNFFFNSDKDPFNNQALRQAIALAIDYESIVDLAFSGLATASDTSLLSTGNSHYFAPDGENDYIRYDVEAAKAKMQEAGYPDGLSFSLAYPNADSALSKIAESLQYMLKEINIDVTLEPLESAVFFGVARSEDFTVCLSTSVLPNPKQQVNMIDPRSPHASVTGGSGQRWYPDNDYLTSVIDTCLTSTDEAACLEAFKELGEICREYVPKIGLSCPNTIVISNNDIVGMHIGLAGVPVYPFCYEADFITG